MDYGDKYLLTVFEENNKDDFSRFAFSQYSKDGHKTYFCRFCTTKADKSKYHKTNEEIIKGLKVHEHFEHFEHFLHNGLNFPRILP